MAVENSSTRTPWEGHQAPTPGHIPAALQLDEAASRLRATTRGFAHLGAILKALRDGLPEHTRLHALADAGAYLAVDMESQCDCWREMLDEAVAKLDPAP